MRLLVEIHNTYGKLKFLPKKNCYKIEEIILEIYYQKDFKNASNFDPVYLLLLFRIVSKLFNDVLLLPDY